MNSQGTKMDFFILIVSLLSLLHNFLSAIIFEKRRKENKKDFFINSNYGFVGISLVSMALTTASILVGLFAFYRECY